MLPTQWDHLCKHSQITQELSVLLGMVQYTISSVQLEPTTEHMLWPLRFTVTCLSINLLGYPLKPSDILACILLAGVVSFR